MSTATLPAASLQAQPAPTGAEATSPPAPSKALSTARSLWPTQTAPVAIDETPLSTRDIVLGLAGYVALPGIALLDAAGPSTLSAGVAAPVAALLLSVPSLLVGHQYLGLHADPRALLADVGRVFVHCGRLALGLVPAVGLYAATTRLGPIALAVALAAIGFGSVRLAKRRLDRREAAARPDATDAADRRFRMGALTLAWSVLSLLIGARMGFTLLQQL